MNDKELLSIKQRFGIIGNSPTLNHAISVAIQIAPTDMSVLITGESGSGKESFSKIIHQVSSRKHGHFIAINCGAIPEGTIDSELFGHEKGSFTGAYETRKGYFEVTNGGTIFLDEVGDLPINTQAKLLRVLEYGEFIKVGSSKVQKTDTRVVAATNTDLYEAVMNGRFREDLYYRLNTVPIYVPPLRERGTDIDLLFRKFATDFADKYKVKPIHLTPEAKQLFLRFRFPGNIRQLKNIVQQISVLEVEREITNDTLLKYMPDSSRSVPMLLENNKNVKDGFSERDLLYKILFDLKKDLNDLKRVVYRNFQNKGSDSQLIEDNAELFKSIHQEIPPVSLEKTDETYLLDIKTEPTKPGNSETQDISHETEEESLSIEKKERELVIKALRKNNNKRKYAAQDLGISERTLYRKIKQYELDD